MKPPPLLKPNEIDMLFQAKDAVDNILPWLESGVAKAMPYNDHLQKIKEQRDYLESIISWLKLERPR